MKKGAGLNLVKMPSTERSVIDQPRREAEAAASPGELSSPMDAVLEATAAWSRWSHCSLL